MPPWDELRYYDLIAETVFTNQPLHTQIAKSNPLRVVLVLALQTAGALLVTTNANAAAGQGIDLNNTARVLAWNARDNPVFTQSAWFLNTALGVGNHMTVFEVTMHDWPQQQTATEKLTWLQRLIPSLRNT